MNTILFDGIERKDLFPFTLTRPVADIRMGILSLREKWEAVLNLKTSTKTETYLAEKWPMYLEKKNLFINPAFIPNTHLITQIKALQFDEKLVYQDYLIAYKTNQNEVNLGNRKTVEAKEKPIHISYSYDIFSNNAKAIQSDFDIVTQGKKSQKVPDYVFKTGHHNIFIEEGAKLYNVSLNAEEGPIYIGKDALVMEGCHIRGPFALGDHSVLKMGAKVYGGCSFGPHCKVGGEVNNVVIFGYSNKGHDGFLGNAVLGEWCNIGADSNNSNLKNNYAHVKLWNYNSERFEQTGLQFCGLMMGDHSKCAINTMFNTGTVVGVSANIFGAGFPRNFIPSFSWGGARKMLTYKLDKVYEVAEVVMKRRALNLTDVDKAILQHVFDYTAKYRRD